MSWFDIYILCVE